MVTNFLIGTAPDPGRDTGRQDFHSPRRVGAAVICGGATTSPATSVVGAPSRPRLIWAARNFQVPSDNVSGAARTYTLGGLRGILFSQHSWLGGGRRPSPPTL